MKIQISVMLLELGPSCLMAGTGLYRRSVTPLCPSVLIS